MYLLRSLFLLSIPLATAFPTFHLPRVLDFSSARRDASSNTPKKPFFYYGHDLSSLKLLEDYNNTYFDTARGNRSRPAEDILGDGGMNTVRLRIWVNPVEGVYGLQYNIDFAKRLIKKGYKIYLDFHFADSWADPQQQPTPKAWPTELKPLTGTVRRYVRDSLVAFKKAGVDFEIVALGNEIRRGMLWPAGRVNVDIQPYSALVANFTNLATLFNSARAGVDDALRAGVKRPQIMIHVDNGYNLTLQSRWYSALVDAGVPLSAWDVIGVSIYPFYGTSATFANLRTTLNYLARKYKKPVQVAETDYAAICDGRWGNTIPTSAEPSIPWSVAGQLEWVHNIIDVVKGVDNGLGRGVHYWEPTWLNNTSLGSNCTDAILFEPDYSNWPNTVGYSRESVNMFKQKK